MALPLSEGTGFYNPHTWIDHTMKTWLCSHQDVVPVKSGCVLSSILAAFGNARIDVLSEIYLE